MENLYEILEINNNASTSEIIKAYNLLKIKYPPDKDYDKYQKIWKAYTVLKSDIRRKNYDIYCSCEKNIKDLESDAIKFIEDKDYKSAEESLKKVIALAPDILLFKELLCKVLFKQKKYNDFTDLMNKMLMVIPDASDYFLSYGQLYHKKKEKSSAKYCYSRAFELDHENYDAITNIINYHIKSNTIPEAISFLNKNISYAKDIDYYYYFNIFKLLECYIILEDEKSFNEQIKNIKIPDSNYNRQYLNWKIIQLALKLINSNHEFWAIELMKFNDEIYDKINSDYIHNYNKRNYEAIMNFFTECRRSYLPIKLILLFNEKHDENGILVEFLDNNLKKIQKDFNSVDKKTLTQIKENIDILKNSYPNLYYQQSELFDYLSKGLKWQLRTADEYKRFKKSKLFIPPIKECIRGIELQDDEIFQNNLNMLTKFTISEILSTLDCFSDYTILKERYSPFISALRDKCNELKKK